MGDCEICGKNIDDTYYEQYQKCEDCYNEYIDCDLCGNYVENHLVFIDCSSHFLCEDCYIEQKCKKVELCETCYMCYECCTKTCGKMKELIFKINLPDDVIQIIIKFL